MKRTKIVIIVVAISLLSGCGSTHHIRKGVKHLKNENYETALEIFEDVIEKDAKSEEAYRGKGIACFELERYGEAVEAFETALELGTKETATIYNLLGASCQNSENYENALEYYKKGIARKDANEELLKEMRLNTILVYEKMGNWDSAKEKVAEYLSDYPEDEIAKKEAEFLETR